MRHGVREGLRGPVDADGFLLPLRSGEWTLLAQTGQRGVYARDLRGHRVGSLTFVEHRGSGPGGGRWLVRCDCGRSYVTFVTKFYASAREAGRRDPACHECANRRRAATEHGRCKWCGARADASGSNTRCARCERRRARNGRCGCGHPAYRSRLCPNCGAAPTRRKP